MMDPKLKIDVLPQVREFAQKSVDQAERAISSFMDSASRRTNVRTTRHVYPNQSRARGHAGSNDQEPQFVAPRVPSDASVRTFI
jgi:hypothetical protein